MDPVAVILGFGSNNDCFIVRAISLHQDFNRT